MNRIATGFSVFFSLIIITAGMPLRAETSMVDDPEATVLSDETAAPVMEAPRPVTPAKKTGRISRADAFVAKADWEFDGFVAGGQDQAVRSMFYLNDLVYLNIGTDQGVEPGSRVVIYKRGNRVRDPQTGRFIGYEVRRAAITQATDQVDGKTCSVRILSTYEAVEIGDLVRRE